MKKSVELEEKQVSIWAGDVRLDGNRVLAPGVGALVLFAHGSGSSRHSPRNRFVAGVLQEGHLGTLLFDLLSPEEEQIDLHTGQLRFDIGFLARRLVCAMDWAASQPETKDLRLGLFGSSTGAAAALVAAAQRARLAGAVVSRGGRPDLADQALAKVVAPTLLIVGGNDTPVIELNRQAFGELRCAKELQIIPGATHLFEEPGTLEQAAQLARRWFSKHLAGAAAPAGN
jgi:pimeloyl-ACP methyl ester carboxylesterase